MPYDLAKAVGFSLPDREVAWNKRDLLTYAVGVGAKSDDFSYIYELDPKFSALPTYPVVLALKGAEQDVNLFASRAKGSVHAPGIPPMDPNKMLHGSQSIEVLKKLPLVSGPGWKWTSRYTGISENKSGIVITMENMLVDPNGVPYARLYSSTFNLGAKANGTSFTKVIASAPVAKAAPKNRKPDWIITDQTSPEQAILFRLSGDYNPLHVGETHPSPYSPVLTYRGVDPSIGHAAGFGGVILHGLSTYGFAAGGLIKAIANNDPDALTLFGVRFTSPVKPGDALETHAWEIGPGPHGTTEISFITKNVTTGKISLGSGIAYIKKSEKSKL
ncbi:peroxisomal dehydratase [Guyanagaster necrorhizus]|uniref:Peroxisomal dehydratase n=1 Tax=Guyanagaster necrorhizus TaxID=856835 RepID=A0A9P8ARB7_9AGAR|nr:peroxisomal dehydratase [Guyanagaster necrorhizus MCA 3950]KAG7445233.1 peroxisomal dehydratase [Guyanagaster necrorhizus MCA 3950]